MDRRAKASIAATLLSGGVLALAGAALGGLRVGSSVALGAALGVGNLWAWAQIVQRLLPERATDARAQSALAWALVAALKTVAFAATAWLLMRHGLGSPIAMLVGLGSLPIGIAIAPVLSHTRGSPHSER